MKRFFMVLMVAGLFLTTLGGVTRAAQAGYDYDMRVFATSGFEHVIMASLLPADSEAQATAFVSEYGFKKFLEGFNGADSTNFYAYRKTTVVNLRYADRYVAYKGKSRMGGIKTYNVTVIMSKVGSDVFVFVGFDPTSTFLRYVNACHQTDSIRPAPAGYTDWTDQMSS